MILVSEMENSGVDFPIVHPLDIQLTKSSIQLILWQRYNEERFWEFKAAIDRKAPRKFVFHSPDSLRWI